MKLRFRRFPLKKLKGNIVNMSTWKLSFTPDTEKDSLKLNKEVRKIILEKIKWLGENFDDINPLALTDEWRGFLN